MTNEFRFPSPTERAAIVGRTGSGKTLLGAFVLSRSPFDKMPYVIVDYKRDDTLAKIRRAREIGLNEVPRHPGVYILRLMPGLEEQTEAWLWKVWQKTHIGLYFDEAYLVPDKLALQAILTQGRSLRIPAICVSQRPVQVSRFVFSEADHVALFHLNDERDEDTVKRFTPKGFIEYVPPEYPRVENENRLPDFHSRWYDINKHKKFVLRPVPPADEIVSSIDARLQPQRRWL